MRSWILAMMVLPINAFAATGKSSIELAVIIGLALLTLLLIAAIVWLQRSFGLRQYELIRYASQPMVLSKQDGQIIYINNAAQSLFQRPVSFLRSATVFDLINGLPNCLQQNLKCLNVKEDELCACANIAPYNNDYSITTGKQEDIPVNISVLRQKGGVFVFYLSELSVQKRLEQQLDSQNKVATIGEFLAGALHEVGNPMAAIEGVANDLLWRLEHQFDDFSLDELAKQLRLIQEQARRVNEIKNEFSAVSGHSGPPEQFQLTDINGLLEQLVALAKFDKRSNYIDIQLDNKSSLPAVKTHQGKLTQILLNALSNAIDALQGTDKTDKKINVSASQEGRFVKLVVSDNGEGIDDSELEKIFEPFYTTKSCGTGLGLVICKRLAESLGANFRITSVKNQATNVQLYLPLFEEGA